jgi:DNA-binding transcriptional ArsR family regulator
LFRLEGASLAKLVNRTLLDRFPLPRRTSLITDPIETHSSPVYGERHLKRLLWYLLGGTRGGPMRAEIIKTLQERPSNPHQLAEILGVDYKTIQHHLRILDENGLVVSSKKGAYGAVLLLTPKMEEAIPIMEEIWIRIGRSKISAPAKD